MSRERECALAVFALLAAVGCGSSETPILGLTAGSGDAASSSGTPPPMCTYPEGLYGIEVDKLFAPMRSWPGFADGSDVPTVLHPEDYYDCDGSRGINALVLDESATWCGACQQAAGALRDQVNGAWAGKGIHVLTLMIQDGKNAPATIDTAAAWKKQYNLPYAVGADPGSTFIGGGGKPVDIPVQLLIDPRTMTIVAREEGFSGINPAIAALADKNAMK